MSDVMEMTISIKEDRIERLENYIPHRLQPLMQYSLGAVAFSDRTFRWELCWLLGHPPGNSQVFGVKRMEGYLGILPLFIT
jgi:hypothetical protein